MLVHDMYLYEVKKPSELKGEWDLYKLIATIPGPEAYKRPNGNECPAGEGVIAVVGTPGSAGISPALRGQEWPALPLRGPER